MIRHMNTNFLNSVTNFIKKRTFELLGLVLISLSVALTISFVTYSPSDPSFVYGEENTIIKNFFGLYPISSTTSSGSSFKNLDGKQ